MPIFILIIFISSQKLYVRKEIHSAWRHLRHYCALIKEQGLRGRLLLSSYTIQPTKSSSVPSEMHSLIFIDVYFMHKLSRRSCMADVLTSVKPVLLLDVAVAHSAMC